MRVAMTQLSDREYSIVKDLKEEAADRLAQLQHELTEAELGNERLSMLAKIFGREGLTGKELQDLEGSAAAVQELQATIELLDQRNDRLRRILRHRAIVD
jgi:hypothetical protein